MGVTFRDFDELTCAMTLIGDASKFDAFVMIMSLGGEDCFVHGIERGSLNQSP